MENKENSDLDDLKIALLVRAVRNMMGWNLKELGQHLDVAPSTVGKWESGDLTLKASTYIKLMNLLDKEGFSFELTNQKSELVIKVSPETVKRLAAKPKKKPSILIDQMGFPEDAIIEL